MYKTINFTYCSYGHDPERARK